MPAQGRPLITANQVTLARLIPMPLLAWLIYEGNRVHNNSYLWGALIAGTLIGCTDWVDGMLARKYGPTVLGGLLDPIADKVFIAFAYTPFADSGMVPWWACALMFTREFFITALRSAYEQRGLKFKTSYLAKAKTWTQMQGIGILLLFPLLDNKAILLWLFAAGATIPIVVLVVWKIVKGEWWRGAFVMTGSFGALLAIFLIDESYAPRALMIGIVGITWLSGLDYIVGGWPKLRAYGDFSRADFVRLLGSLTLPILLFAVLVYTDAPRWTIFAILAFELAVGGLDNLLSHHKAATLALAWGGRVLGVSLLLGGALLMKDQAKALAIVACAVSVFGCTAEFIRGRAYYIDHLME
ncbi:MAG TPA: CDP-alcohol phosphatidyltransferase family protein [Kofleriaceae bacterium]|nr:CDP-alcohol phosphatidyltransferase family protein [Kofleriaceae bacterium]